MGESPEETRKLVEHWPKFGAEIGMNSEFMSTSESLKGREMHEKCLCWHARASKCMRLMLNG